tara:strand:- start:200 stop:631 length:432 start_codon:yes stop_codon:yes gene_type:complete
MNKIIAVLLLILFPFTLFADELPKISPLSEGDPAPFSGVLYNPAAVAETIAQKEFLIEQHELNLSALKERLDAECNLKISNLQADLDAFKTKYDSMTEIKDEEIKKLQNIVLKQTNEYSHWWFVGGILTGTLITIGAVYATNQ